MQTTTKGDLCPKKQEGLERLATFQPDEVLPYVVTGKNCRGAEREYAGQPVKMWSLRYQTFKQSMVCCQCGVEGIFFALERHSSAVKYGNVRYHLNLYAIDDEGDEVLMTKDHIVPRAHGGADAVENMQTMCKPCNEKRGCGNAPNFIVFSGCHDEGYLSKGANSVSGHGDRIADVRQQFFDDYGYPDAPGPDDDVEDGVDRLNPHEYRGWEWYQILHVPTLTVVEDESL